MRPQVHQGREKRKRGTRACFGPPIGCCYPDYALRLIEEEVDLLVIGGQGFIFECSASMNAHMEPDTCSPKYLAINCCNGTYLCSVCQYCSSRPNGERLGRRNHKTGKVTCCQGHDHPACCTQFHKVYCLKTNCCCLEPCLDDGLKFNRYVDEHLEWKDGSELVKQMLREGKNREGRVSSFSLAGTPFSPEQRASFLENDAENGAELDEVVIVADTETETETTTNPAYAEDDEDVVSNPVAHTNSE